MTTPFKGKIGIDIRDSVPDWALSGATVTQVVVDVSGEPYVDLETEAVGAFMRD